MTVYLIHLHQPMARGVSARGTSLFAQHYIGWAKDLEERLEEHTYARWTPYEEPFTTSKGKTRLGHTRGNGATFLAVANSRNIPWSLARVWQGADQKFERRLKNQKKAHELCPLCNPKALNHMKGKAS